MCDDVLCTVVVLFWNALKLAWQAYQDTLKWITWAWAELQPHLQWLGPLFGIAMGAWRWWDKRESVIWRRVMRLLADQGRYVQQSCQHSLASILYPSPATTPQEAVFAVPSLRRVFARRWWHFLYKPRPIAWANSMLRRTHDQLDDKDGVIREHRSFAVGQRYSAFVLQGAIAAAVASKEADDQARKRLDQTALDRFKDALAQEGKEADAIVLELRALQLRKLGRYSEASEELNKLQVLLEGRLQGVTPVEPSERQRLLVQLLRVGRYQSEMDHAGGGHGGANARLLRLTQSPISSPVFQDHLEFRDRLERAYFHEVHACIRVRLTATVDGNGTVILPNNGVAHQSLSAARSDFEAVLDQVSPRRFSWPVRVWRWVRRKDAKDGSSQMRAAVADGLRRVDDIQAGRWCQFCRTQDNGAMSGTVATSPTISG